VNRELVIYIVSSFTVVLSALKGCADSRDRVPDCWLCPSNLPYDTVPEMRIVKTRD
jgi:hypothetical protein